MAKNQNANSLGNYTNSNPLTAAASGSALPINPVTGQANAPIGVPAGYTAQVPVPGGSLTGPGGVPFPFPTTASQGARYYAGDQWGGIDGFPSDQAGLTQLQQQLIQAGYLNPKQTLIGQWDSTSANAFAELLGAANQSGKTWQNELGLALTNAPATSPSVPPLTVSLSNPDDIKAIAQNAAKTLNGTYMNDDELNKFVASFQAQEQQAQTQAYNQQYNPQAGGYGPGGTTVSAPSSTGAEQQAEQMIRQDHPQQLASNTFLANLNSIVGALTGGKSVG